MIRFRRESRLSSEMQCLPFIRRVLIHRVPGAVLVLIVGLVSCSADQERDPNNDGGTAQGARSAGKVQDVLVFPAGLHVADDSVNAFVQYAMTQCAGGDYETFRLLWSARDEVLPREEYEKGWQAVREIRLRQLRKVALVPDPEHGHPEPEIVHALLADVSLDPEHPAARDEPTREVALMIVREHDEWKLAKAPRAMREWLREKAGERPPDAPAESARP